MADNFRFAESDSLLCFHGPMLYEAKCLKRRKTSDGKAQYFIHYKGWNSKWEEWVDDDRVLAVNTTNMNKMTSLKELHSSSKKGGAKRSVTVVKEETIRNTTPPVKGRKRKHSELSLESSQISSVLSPVEPKPKKRGRPPKTSITTQIETAEATKISETTEAVIKTEPTKTFDATEVVVTTEEIKVTETAEAIKQTEATKVVDETKASVKTEEIKKTGEFVKTEATVKTKKIKVTETAETNKKTDATKTVGATESFVKTEEINKTGELVKTEATEAAVESKEIKVTDEIVKAEIDEKIEANITEGINKILRVEETEAVEGPEAVEETVAVEEAIAVEGTEKVEETEVVEGTIAVGAAEAVYGSESVYRTESVDGTECSSMDDMFIVPAPVVKKVPVINIPQILNKRIAYDSVMVNTFKKVLKFPKLSTVQELMESYIFSKPKSHVYWERSFNIGLTLVNYFNLLIHKQLLYEVERESKINYKAKRCLYRKLRSGRIKLFPFRAIMCPPKLWYNIYSPTYLLRLFAILPELLTTYSCTDKQLDIMVEGFEDFLKYVEDNYEKYFSENDYRLNNKLNDKI